MKKARNRLANRHRTGLRFLTSLFVCLVFIGSHIKAASAETEESSVSVKRVLLMRQAGVEATGYDELLNALTAHLGRDEFQVEILVVESTRRQEELTVRAAELTRSESAHVVLWLQLDTQTLFLFYQNDHGEHARLSRTFSCTTSNLGACVDAIGAAVRSALGVWMEEAREETAGENEENSNKTEAVPQASDNELNPVPLESPDWTAPASHWSLAVTGGYVFNFGKSDSIAHGIHLGVGAVRWQRLALGLSGEILGPIQSDTGPDDSRAELYRRPFRITVGQIFNTRVLTLGVHLGALISVDYIRRFSQQALPDQETFVVPGLTSKLTLHTRFHRRFRIWAKFGAEIYSRTDAFKTNDATSINLGALQCQAAIGLAIWFDRPDKETLEPLQENK